MSESIPEKNQDDEFEVTQPVSPPEMLPPSPSEDVTQTDMPALSEVQRVALHDTQPTPKVSAVDTQTMRGVTPPQGVRRVLRRPKKRRSRMRLFSGGCLLTFGAAAAVFVGLLVIVGIVVVNSLSYRLEEGLQRLDELEDRRSFQTTVIHDRNGEELYQIFDEGRRTNVSLGELPSYVGLASIAVEDDTFYDNPGVDLGSIFRALLQNVQEGEIYSGASTITQQLVKQIAFDYEYRIETSYQRKIEEAILALILTNRLSKDEILELYLNEIYYGNLAYGIEAASQTILGKPAAQLTLGEAALLAGLPQAPAELDPLNPDPEVQEAVLARRRLVIDLMLERGYITQQQAFAAYGEPLSYASPDVPLVAPHFTVSARDELESLLATLGYGPEVIFTSGLQVYTTLDLRFQEMAERIARQQVAALRDAHNLTNASVVVMHPVTGEVVAMVGSIDYWDDAIDGRVNVALAPRQPGSTMKPFTYAAAMEQGMSAAGIIWDTETRIDSPGQPAYAPVNYDRQFHGPVRLRDALASSYNVPAVQTLRKVGVSYLLNLMERFGVNSLGSDASYYGLSLTLGGGEVTLLELTRAYSVFANGGLLVPTTTIRCVVDGDDNIIYQYENGCPFGQNTPATVNVLAYGVEVLDPRIAFLISDVLADNAARTPAMGASSPLYTGDLVSSVKTGTTNDTRDNWTVGFTHNVAIGVWAGNSDNSAMVDTSGLSGAAPIWHDVLQEIYEDPDMLAVLAQDGQLIPDFLVAPPGMSRLRVCELSTLQDPASDCPTTRVEWFLDSAARVPDGSGGLMASPNWYVPQLQVADPNGIGPQLTEIERDLFQALVVALPEPVALSAVPTNVPPGQPAPPPPRYCLVPNEVKTQFTTARSLLFIAAPADPTDAVYATQWAQANNMPILPAACSTETLSALLQANGTTVVTAYISSPSPNQVVNEVIPIIGTADLTPPQAVSYKFEIRGPQFPNWVTLGEVHTQAVFDSQLEVLAAAGLQPGQYFLRLIIIAPDGNYLQTPYEVPFSVP